MFDKRIHIHAPPWKPEAIERLLELRTQAYRAVGKHRHATTMRDEFDEKAIHVGVWIGSKPIACARVIALPPAATWEHDRFIDWQEGWPPRERTAEISRFAIDPAHRNWKTIKMLCHGIALAMYSTGRHYFIACCTEGMSGFYTRFFGARFTGHSIAHSELGPKPHLMFISHYTKGLLGEGLKTFAWLSIWPGVALTGLLSTAVFEPLSLSRRAVLVGKCLLGVLVAPLVGLAIDIERCRVTALIRGRVRG